MRYTNLVRVFFILHLVMAQYFCHDSEEHDYEEEEEEDIDPEEEWERQKKNNPDLWYYDLEACGQIEAEGTYCNWDQTGYVDCIYHEKYWDFYSGGVNWTTCPEGTRCSCFKDTECKVPKDKICKPLEIFPAWPDVFHLTFEKTYVYIRDIWLPKDELDPPKIIKGSLKHDKNKGKVFLTENDKSVLIQKENNGFAQYTWNNKDDRIKCEREEVDELQTFLPDLKYYQFWGSTKAGNKEIRTYYFQNGPLNSWAHESFRYWWKIVYDAATDTMLPMTYKYVYTDVDMGDTAANDDFVYKIHEVPSNTDSWFNLPKHCS